MAVNSTERLLGISPSPYEVQEAFLELSNSFFKPENVNNLTAGLFGYVNHIMARSLSDSAFHRNSLYNENFLNTAEYPKSIYNFAKQYNYSIGASNAASCKIICGIFKDDMIKAIGQETPPGVINNRFVIPRGHTFLLGKYNFSVAGEIIIEIIEDKITAFYNTNNMDFTSDIGNGFIKSYKVPRSLNADGSPKEMLFLELVLYQVTLKTTEYKIISKDINDTSFFRIAAVSGQSICRFNVLYQEPGQTSWEKLACYFNENETPLDSKYAYYAFTESGGIEFYFSQLLNNFRPKFNSKLLFEYYNTYGDEGNFEFSGVMLSQFTELTKKHIIADCAILTNPSGGTERESLLTIKKNIQKNFMHRDSIITEADLNAFLSSLIDSSSINDSKITFVKTTDDVILRAFTAYLLLKDSTGNIIPTNTAKVGFSVEELEANGWAIRAGSFVVYDHTTAMYRTLVDGEFPEYMIDDPNSFVYAVPFTMVFRLKPFPRIVYYKMNLDKSLSVSSDGLSNRQISTVEDFNINAVSARRNSILENSILFDIPVSTQLQPAALRSKCIVRIKFYDKNKRFLGMSNAMHIVGSNVFRFELKTEDKFTNNCEMIFTNEDIFTETDQVIPDCSFPEGMHLKIAVYYDDGNQRVNAGVDTVTIGNTIYKLAREFSTREEFSLYENLEKVMSSDLAITDKGIFVNKNMPLIGASFFLNPSKMSEILKITDKYHVALGSAFDLLQNNTAVDIKFANTYGPSLNFKGIDRINISLSLNIKLNTERSRSLEELITYSCLDFILGCNENANQRFSISNLISYLEGSISQIDYIEFNTLNGIRLQSTNVIFFDRTGVNAVPEYLNVRTKYTASLNTRNFAPDITLNFI